MSKPVVVLAIPSRGLGVTDYGALFAGMELRASKTGEYTIHSLQAWRSTLTPNFNLLWVNTLNGRKQHNLTHFAMIHDDIAPETGWLDVLLDEMDATGADLVSAVVPMKSAMGLTSTALDNTGDEWNPQRLTLKEIHNLPETFDSKDAGGPLLLNTGCWVCRLDRPWVNNVVFRQQDQIRLVDGQYEAHQIPEDWDFSRQVSRQGGKLVGTRKVRLYHERPEWTNTKPWGQWSTDVECQKYFGDRAPNAVKAPAVVATDAEPLPIAL